MIKSMRDASFGDSLFPGENQLFRDMYDERLAQTLSQGRGLGLQATIARQLGGQAAVGEQPSNPVVPPPAANRQQALRAYQAHLPASPQAAAAPLAQAAMLAPLAMALDAMDGRETGALHQRLQDSPTTAIDNPLDLIAAAGGDWSRSNDRWQPNASGVDATEAVAARQAASQFPGNSPEAFVARLWPHARRAADELGVDQPVRDQGHRLEGALGQQRHP